MKKYILGLFLVYGVVVFGYSGTYYFDYEMKDSLVYGSPVLIFGEKNNITFKVVLRRHGSDEISCVIEKKGIVVDNNVQFLERKKEGGYISIYERGKIFPIDGRDFVYVNSEDHRSSTVRKVRIEERMWREENGGEEIEVFEE